MRLFGEQKKVGAVDHVLGKTMRGSVSGFQGVATSKHEYLNGCMRVSLQPKVDKDGKLPDSRTFDSPQLQMLEDIQRHDSDNSTGGPDKYMDEGRTI